MNNPDNYISDGTVKKGARTWHRSKHYQRLAAKATEVERKVAATQQETA